jgi:hypothetical protein
VNHLKKMKTIYISLLALLLSSMAVADPLAQGFSSGSNGSYGPLDITTNTTLELPGDGIFHCTTVNVAQGSTLRFKRNPLNTPVYLLATSNVTVNGTIDVSGSNSDPNVPDGGVGGPGGFDGGKPGFGSVPPGTGHGPGGGGGGVYDRNSPSGAGCGSYGTVGESGSSTNKGRIYGSPLLIPIIGGSGGGGTAGAPGRGGGGGGGGGAILISSSTRIDVGSTGKILAMGGGNRASGDDWPAYLHNPGSGGAIRLVAPTIAGTGQLNAWSGNNVWGGHGRIRVDSINRTALQFSFQPASVTSVGSAMFVFPEPRPRLDIIEAAGRVIPEGANAPVYIQLPFGSATNRTVKVQARNFNTVVPIKVVLTPDNGPQTSFLAQIDNKTTNPAQVTVDVVVPVNVQVTVNAWTR